KGGDMISTISKSVMMINDKIQIEHDIESMMTQRKLEGGLITLMPFLVILLMKFSSPTYMDIMYGSLQGRLIMTGALGGIAAAYIMIRKIMEIRI
ncbi:MAG: hypothetical protein PUB39_02020, partial [Eubacteriales bacterium]|nr:hypothetical protein [Eubacteriales bacterium]